MPLDSDSLHRRQVRYFYDCLAAQTDSARAINVVDQKDVVLVPLAASEQRKLGEAGSLSLGDDDAIALAQRVALGGAHTTLFLGALFLVGRIPPKDNRAEQRICAPLLEIPLSIQQRSSDEITFRPDEVEFTINYGLLSELLRGDEDDLQDRLADIAELVPDFPIDACEFDTFWNGFRVIAPEVQVSDQAPVPRDTTKWSTRIADLGLACAAADEGVNNGSDGLRVVDFFVPRIPKGDAFQLLPATSIVFGRKVGRAMSALSELREMEDLPLSKTAFSCVFDPAKAGDCPLSRRASANDVQPLSLTPTQQSIVESSRFAPLTVVTGPPGTGKSYTITAIVLDALLRGESVLVASQMDKAVEVVAGNVERVAGPLAIARSGGRAAQRDLAKKVARLTGPRSGGGEAGSSDVDACNALHDELTRQVQQLEKNFQDVIEAERRWSEAYQDCASAEPFLKFPIQELGHRRVRKAHKLHSRAQRNCDSDAGTLRRLWARWDMSRLRRMLGIPTGSAVNPDELEALLRFYMLKSEMREIDRSLRQSFPSDLTWQELASVERRRHETAIELLRLMRDRQMRMLVSNKQYRTALRDLATLLRRRKRKLKQELKDKLSADLLLEAFPAWACTSRSLCEILPANPGMFDLVVIDEASQCDLALASVALMRGRRAVIVGDPNQLRHVCFLSSAREQASLVRNEFTAAMRERFNYRRSLFDVAADMVDQRNFFFLSEHFRSHPQIIGFSNQRFYDESLQVMTSRPSTNPQSAIQIVQAKGKREPDSSVNLAEVEAVFEAVKAITDHENGSAPPSIGVVSPFRDHADAINDRFLSEYSAETIAKHSLVVGTAHSLQGDEKDVIIFTTSIDPDSHPASLRFLESPNLFNVAITRARRELMIVTSVSREDLPTGLLREFLFHAESDWWPKQSMEDSNCHVETTICNQLKTGELETWTGFRSAGARINVVAMDECKSVAILCDRYHAGDESAWDQLASQRRIVRAGWNVIRIPHRTVRENRPALLEKVLEALA